MNTITYHDLDTCSPSASYSGITHEGVTVAPFTVSVCLAEPLEDVGMMCVLRRMVLSEIKSHFPEEY